MMIGAGATARLFKWFAAKRMELALAVRVTVAAGLTFVAVKLVDLSQSSWAVITSIIVMPSMVDGATPSDQSGLRAFAGGAPPCMAPIGIVSSWVAEVVVSVCSSCARVDAGASPWPIAA